MADEKFIVLGELNRALKKKPVLVGGGAAELYSAGHFVTGDIDIFADRDELLPLLAKMGFSKEGMYFIRGKVFIHLLGSHIEKRFDDILLKGTGLKVRVISVEDLIVDRLNACKWWRSKVDCEQATHLLNTYRDRLDTGYLEDRAEEEDVRDTLDELRASIAPHKNIGARRTKRKGK